MKITQFKFHPKVISTCLKDTRLIEHLKIRTFAVILWTRLAGNRYKETRKFVVNYPCNLRDPL